MSVSAYISEFKERVDKLIQKNIQKAADNPYPIDELNEIKSSDPDSAIAKMFDESGELVSGLSNDVLAGAAAAQNKDLYNRLRKGSRYMKRVAYNEHHAAKDPNAELNKLYNKFVSEVGKSKSLGGDIDLDDILGSDEEDFGDMVTRGMGIDSEFASTAALRAAFKELRETSTVEPSEPEESADPLNDEDLIDDLIDEADPLNEGETSETEEVIEGEVTESTPELEKELTPTDDNPTRDEIDTERGFVDTEPPSPINSDVFAGDKDIDGDGTVTDAEYSNSVISNITENVQNEVNSINDQVTEINNNDLRGSTDVDSETDDTDIKSDSPNINESTASTGSGFFDDDMAAVTPEELAFLQKKNGTTPDVSNVEESSSIINELNEDNSQTSGDVIENSTSVNSTSPGVDDTAVIDEAIGETEVTKDKVGIDKKIAPINTPPVKEKEEASVSDTADVKLTEVNSETNTTNTPATTDDSSVTNNETNNSESNSAGYSMTDMSGVEARLRKIENILSGPLDVKIVD